MVYTAGKPTGMLRVKNAFALIYAATLVFLSTWAAQAAPHSRQAFDHVEHEAPGWMSDETAHRLSLGFEVLVPPIVPEPFTGGPSVTASERHYGLYWMISGGEPTFLQITGDVGGSIPAYSKYDRNNQLSQNADVAGIPAFHDLTPIYDLIYWQVGDVVYSVESRNLSATDSPSLAAALVKLSEDREDGTKDAVSLSIASTVSAGQVASIWIEGAPGASLTADAGVFPETGDRSIDRVSRPSLRWQAPSPEHDLTVRFVLSDPKSGVTLAMTSTVVVADAPRPALLKLACPSSVYGGESIEVLLSGSGAAVVDGSSGSFPEHALNKDFAPDTTGERTLAGEVPAIGSVKLVWTAPVVDAPTLTYLFATNTQGQTTGECEISVLRRAATDGPGSSADFEVGSSSGSRVVAAAGFEPASAISTDTGATAGGRNQESEPTPRSTEIAEQPTAVIVNEVRGLPTTTADDNEDDEGSTSTESAVSPSPTPNLTPTVRPTATIAPTVSEDGMVAAIIGPGGGLLRSPLGATVEIPEGALSEPATLSIRPVANTKLPVDEGIQIVPDSAFDVTVAGPDGRAILGRLAIPAELRIELPEDSIRSGTTLFRVEGVELVPVVDTRMEDNTLIVSVDQFSRFVAGTPVPVQAGQSRSLMPFIFAAVIVVIVMLGMFILGAMFRPRRHRVVASRRPPRPNQYR